MNVLAGFIHILNEQVVVAMTTGVAIASLLAIVYCIKKQNVLLEQINKLNEDLQVSNRGSIGMGQQIIALEKQLQRIRANARGSLQETTSDAPSSINMSQFVSDLAKESQSLEKIPAPPTESELGSSEVGGEEHDKLNLARDLLAQGKALTEVASTCELSFAEVSLLRALNPTDSPPNHPHAH